MARNGTDPDGSLVSAAIAGDRAAFSELLERHYDRIHGLAWQLTGSRADADDIAQDVCCALVEKIGGFRGEAKFGTWLCGIVYNACRDHHRRRRSVSPRNERLKAYQRRSLVVRLTRTSSSAGTAAWRSCRNCPRA